MAKAAKAPRRKPAGAAPELWVAEPSAAYRVAPPIVVDCNLIGAMLFQEPERSLAEQRIAGRALHAPRLLDYEIVNVALKKSLLGRAELASDGVERYVQVPIDLHEVDVLEVLALARRYTLSAYDASYLWLAAELKAPLATFDRKLGQAAQRHLSALE